MYELIGNCITRVNSDFAKEPTFAKSQIHRFLILPKELSADDGTLTRMGKLRRDVITERYKSLVDAMYEGRTEVRLDTEGAHAGQTSIDLKIRDVRVVAPAHERGAA